MKKVNLTAMMVILFTIGFTGAVSAQTDIDACTVIDSPGYYVLTQDIMNSSTTCIEITSNDVVLDGNGHLIDGSGSGYGVYVNDVSNITLKNLEVTDWVYGVYFNNVSDGSIKMITASSSSTGIVLESSSHIIVQMAEIYNNSNGIKIYPGMEEPESYNSIINSNISNNNGVGIYLGREDNILIDGNIITNNTGSGIYLEFSFNNTISNNIISHNNQGYSYDYAGLHLYNSHNNTITGNYISNNPRYGVIVHWSNFNLFSENDIVFNCGGEYGVILSYSHFNTFESNNISHNTGSGVEIWMSDNNSFISNTINSNGLHGAVIGWSSENTTFADNVISGNLYGGITIYYTNDITITGNTVTDNSDWGMYITRSFNVTVYNNFFSNWYNVYSYSNGYSHPITWNITKTPGKNIAGGPYLGGNFWGKPDGTGFSQTCNDTDKDGFCDSPYIINERGDIDYLPLVLVKVKPHKGAKSFMIESKYFRAEQIGLRQRVGVNHSATFYIWLKNMDDEPLRINISAVQNPITPGNITVNLAQNVTLASMDEATVPLEVIPAETGSFIICVEVYSPDAPYIRYDFTFVVDSY